MFIGGRTLDFPAQPSPHPLDETTFLSFSYTYTTSSTSSTSSYFSLLSRFPPTCGLFSPCLPSSPPLLHTKSSRPALRTDGLRRVPTKSPGSGSALTRQISPCSSSIRCALLLRPALSPHLLSSSGVSEQIHPTKWIGAPRCPR